MRSAHLKKMMRGSRIEPLPALRSVRRSCDFRNSITWEDSPVNRLLSFFSFSFYLPDVHRRISAFSFFYYSTPVSPTAKRHFPSRKRGWSGSLLKYPRTRHRRKSPSSFCSSSSVSFVSSLSSFTLPSLMSARDIHRTSNPRALPRKSNSLSKRQQFQYIESFYIYSLLLMCYVLIYLILSTFYTSLIIYSIRN